VANLTIAVDDDVLRRARVKAAEQGTSINAVLRGDLERYAAGDGAEEAIDEFLALARRRPAHGGPSRQWSREDLYAERLHTA
jgi:plasmid stability protein